MSEADLIDSTPFPRTRESLADDLRRLGLSTGMTVLLHSSLSRIGWVNGGSVAVVQALMDVVTPEGTLVMPAQSGALSDPAEWRNPPVPREWWQTIRDTMPAYDPEVTPTRQMGQIVEAFRTWPGALRSSHPSTSFAAWGRHANVIIADHSLDYGLGERSPLARIYELDGWVLLLGVGYENNTSFHLAEYRVTDPPLTEQGAPVVRDGRRVWATYQDVDIDSEPFSEIGAAFEETGQVREAKVGSAAARLFPQRPAVDFAVHWLTEARSIPFTQ